MASIIISSISKKNTEMTPIYGRMSKIFNVHTLGAYMHINSKYQASMLKSVARRPRHRR